MKLRLSESKDQSKLIRKVGDVLPFQFRSLFGAFQWFGSTHPKARKKKVEVVNHFERLMARADALLT